MRVKIVPLEFCATIIDKDGVTEGARGDEHDVYRTTRDGVGAGVRGI